MTEQVLSVPGDVIIIWTTGCLILGGTVGTIFGYILGTRDSRDDEDD